MRMLLQIGIDQSINGKAKTNHDLACATSPARDISCMSLFHCYIIFGHNDVVSD